MGQPRPGAVSRVVVSGVVVDRTCHSVLVVSGATPRCPRFSTDGSADFRGRGRLCPAPKIFANLGCTGLPGDRDVAAGSSLLSDVSVDLAPAGCDPPNEICRIGTCRDQCPSPPAVALKAEFSPQIEAAVSALTEAGLRLCSLTESALPPMLVRRSSGRGRFQRTSRTTLAGGVGWRPRRVPRLG